MGEPLQVEVSDVGGGQNDGVEANKLEENQFASLRNWYPFGSEMYARKGITRVTTSAYAEKITSILGVKMDDTWQLFAGTETGLARKDAGGLVRIIPSDIAAYASSLEPWRMRLYKNVLYTVRRNTGLLKRAKTDFVQDAGIAAATAGPTLTEGAAGSLLAGNYYGVVTGYNNQTDAESNPSPASLVLALTASKKINWSNIPTFLNGQVNARRLYRTLKDQQGEYYFVAQIDDNFTTTYTGDDFGTSGLGRQVSFRNGLPPEQCGHIEIWKERCFIADDTTVFFSEAFLPEAFYALSQIDVYPDDGHKITGLHAFGDRLVVAKTNAVHYLVGTDSSDFALLTLSDRHGCIAPDSLKSAEGFLFWYEGSNVYRSDGSAVASISDLKIRRILDRIPKAYKHICRAAIYPSKSQYRLSIPVDGDTVPSLTLVYNYRTGAWTVFDSPYGGPTAMGDFYDDNESQLIYGAYDPLNCIFDLDRGNTDDGEEIDYVFDTRAHGFGTEGQLKAMHRFQLQTDADAGQLELTLIRDMNGVAYRTRSMLSLEGGPWKRYNLSNLRDLAKNIQIRGTYRGLPDKKISAYIMEAVAFKRSSQPR